ncbi:MAG: hypothetical protein C0498_03160 [Anaerolinea sp.]|jgi:hypothetical protein|nr:hypothetical protein [Anaerolinea sp.]
MGNRACSAGTAPLTTNERADINQGDLVGTKEAAELFGVRSMPDPEAVAEVAVGWLRHAKSDLVMARKALADRDELDPWVASLHAQQAAEKYVKAALVIPEPTWSDAEEAVRLAESIETDILAGARSRGVARLE